MDQHMHTWEVGQFPHEPCGCAQYYCVGCGELEPETHISGCPQGEREGQPVPTDHPYHHKK